MNTRDRSNPDEADALRALARALAPLIAEELGLGAPRGQRRDVPVYDEETCRRFLSAAHLGDSVLLRAQIFFAILDLRGRVNSAEVVAALGLKGPTSIAANLTNPLKKRAARLGIGLPWREEADESDRTLWVDEAGNAARLVVAIEKEVAQRELAPASTRNTTEGR